MEREREVADILSAYDSTRDSIYKDLVKTFKNDQIDWAMVINRDSLSIEFNKDDFIFKTGQDEVRESFKEILQVFFPKFIDVLYQEKYRHKIVEVRIEGHTNSLWEAETDSLKRYQKNMALSQARTRRILDFLLSQKLEDEQSRWLQGKISANGFSFSRRKWKEKNIEDFEKSKRVEFRVITDAEAELRKALNKIHQLPEVR